jgi:hypothetical protein
MTRGALLGVAWLLCAHATYAQSVDAEPDELAREPESESVDDASEASTGPRVEALSETELDALGLESAGPRVDTDFHLWGFADFNSGLLYRSLPAATVAQGEHQSFYVGNLNLYLSKNLSESFRTMTEVRFTYLPNGSSALGTSGFQQVDTSAVDYANGQSLTRWGGIILQRVYLEWAFHRLLAVRGGQFMTPIGIWNVDHGSPVYIPAQRPIAIVSGLFPERQMGLEFFGRWSQSNDHTVGYHLTLSNGTGPISEYKDLDRNKAVGGRIYSEFFGEKTYVRSGFSAYYGRDTVSTPTATLTGATIDLGNKLSSQADNLALAADVLLKRGGLQLQTEWLTLQRRYTASGRVEHGVVSAPVARGASADALSWAGYVLAAYRIPAWFGLTPFATFQTMLTGQLNASLPDARFKMRGFTFGMTVSPVDSVVFKMEVVHVRHVLGVPILLGYVNALLFQAAWAF